MKQRLAIWLHGGLGTGHFNQGYPMLDYLLLRLADTFEIVVYSHAPPNPGYSQKKILIKTPSVKKHNALVRWAALANLFIRDHQEKRYNVIVAFWGWPAGVITVVLGKIFGIPSAVYLLGGDAAGIASIDYGVLHRPLAGRMVLCAYRATTLLLGISRYQEDTLSSFGLRRRMVIIPWGTDPAVYQFAHRQPGAVLHFIHVGHLSPVKDQATLLRAFALINQRHPSELHLFGVDCMDGKMQALCRELAVDDKVKFMGMVAYDKMPSHYRWADIMLHTSLSEGQSMALTEAAASGVLMAGTAVGLLYDLGEEFGIVVPAGDYERLAREIIAILQHPHEWQRKIFNAKDWSTQHTLEWTASELTKQLEKL